LSSFFFQDAEFTLENLISQLSTLKNLAEINLFTDMVGYAQPTTIKPLTSVRLIRFDDFEIHNDPSVDLYNFVRIITKAFPKLERILFRESIPDHSFITEAVKHLGVKLDTY